MFPIFHMLNARSYLEKKLISVAARMPKAARLFPVGGARQKQAPHLRCCKLPPFFCLRLPAGASRAFLLVDLTGVRAGTYTIKPTKP